MDIRSHFRGEHVGRCMAYLAPNAHHCKLFATLQARAALDGIEARSIEGDDGRDRFIVTDNSAALTLSFATINELAAWLVERAAGREAA